MRRTLCFQQAMELKRLNNVKEKTMKKLALSVITLILTMATLASCQIPGLGLGGTTDKVSYTRLVLGDDSVTAGDLAQIRSAIFNLSGAIDIVEESKSATDGEIVFGDSDRAVTSAAKKKMQSEFAKNGTDCGYIIYAEGKCVAVYWTEEDMKEIALAKFLSECVDKMKLDLEAGIVIFQGYTTKEFIQEKEWEALRAEGCDEETIEALKSIYNFYNGSVICEWMANLWDNDIGGFYYSNSARDNEPFRPDLESTNQLTNWLVSNNATGGLGRNEFFPNHIKKKIVEFARAMQSSVDGYFYHPQWPQGKDKLATDRYGRDLSWGTSLIKSFRVDTDGDGIEEQQYPNWCAPSGDKCKKHAKNGGSCDFSTATTAYSASGFSTAATNAEVAVTASLRESAAGAAYRVRRNSEGVIATASTSSKPDYSGSAAFTNWLWAYNGTIEDMMSGSRASGNAHNINALQSEIISKGFGDELVAWLDDVQQQMWDYQVANNEDPTGMWQTSIDKRAVWSVIKYMPFYNSKVCGKAIELEKALAMVRTCTKVIELAPDKNWALNDLMNQWQSVNHIISNIENHHGASAAEQARAIVRENIVYRIENSIAKIEMYKLDSGVFAYTTTRRSPTAIYGVPISMGAEEGDVNGNSLVCSMYRGIFEALDYRVVPLCNELDGENFLRILDSVEPIVKIPQPVGKDFDFEDGDVPVAVTANANTSEYELSCAVDPEDPNNGVLYFKSGTHASNGDYLYFNCSGAGNCNIMEMRFYFKDTCTPNKTQFQVKLGESYMMTMGLSGGRVYIGERTGTGTCISNPDLYNFKYDGWFKLRVEIYDETSTGTESPQIKIFVDDELVIESNNYYNKHDPSKTFNKSYSSVRFLSSKGVFTEVYFDDVFVNCENKSYEEGSDDVSDSRDN